jgi:hypothetical protein
LTSDGFNPLILYQLVKKVYGHRSTIVHGGKAKSATIEFGGQAYPAQHAGVMLLRRLLLNRSRAEEPWTPEALDKHILESLASKDDA